MPMYNPPHSGEALREDVLSTLGVTEIKPAEYLEYPVEQLDAVLNCSASNTDLAQRMEQAGLGRARVWLAEQAAYYLWQSQH